jgi:hypothetical protein
MSTKKPEYKLFRQNHENNFDDGRSCYAGCSLCCCASCTGFACPWVKKIGFVHYYFKIGMKFDKRCLLCYKNNYDFKRIYDCDFYTYHKRRRFFAPRRLRRKKQKIDVIGEKLDLILKKMKEG